MNRSNTVCIIIVFGIQFCFMGLFFDKFIGDKCILSIYIGEEEIRSAQIPLVKELFECRSVYVNVCVCLCLCW